MLATNQSAVAKPLVEFLWTFLNVSLATKY